nr:disease resistance-like protein csa1 [Quercus suber]
MGQEINNIGTEVVEGIKLITPIEIEEHLSAEAFSKMKKLRLLKIGYEQTPQDLIRATSNNYGKELCDSQNLIEIPDLSGAPNLKQLILQQISSCTHLRMLPKLPLNIEYIDATNCTSLETLSLRPEYDFRPKFRFLNCGKLIENQGYGDVVSTMLRRYIINTQSLQHSYHYSVGIPGSEILKWFSHQNVGASVNLQVPSDSLASSTSPTSYSRLWRYDSQIEVKFEPEGPGLEVTKCGAHLVFERDIEDLINQTKAGPSSCIITAYDEDGFEDLEKDTKIKRSHDDSDREGAGPSGEASSNEEPPDLNLIENCYSFYGICTADQLFFSLILLYEEVFGLCWKGETVTLLADKKAFGTDCMVH